MYAMHLGRGPVAGLYLQDGITAVNLGLYIQRLFWYYL